ncbi:hypothetical protein DFJ63DRAFT_317882 [Scheffersomyces coipomensis]|uniref:uncharacterized protein n=1 Tax=Scheffersomyces coipomensis TaxID=1788519 RepID=UPI00315DB846
MPNSRRSVSPQTVTESNVEYDPVTGRKIKKPVSRLSSLVSYFKAPIARIFQAPPQGQTNQESSTIKFPGHLNDVDRMIIEDEPLNDDFTSIKKKRLSIQAMPSTDSIPRSSTLNNSLGTYKTYYNSFHTSNEEVSNDLERRLSTAYSNGVVKDGVVNSTLNPIVEQEFSRDASPLGILPRLDTPMSLQTVTSRTESVNDGTPMMIEHEYAPLYQDDEGNLVRPPFINLDPRERYHLLQLKRSVQESESIKRKIKYMVDPNETMSSINPETKKVETSTQTHDISYLSDSLVFKTKKRGRRITSLGSNDNRIKRAKTSNKLFSGEFFYDVKLDDKKQSKDIIDDLPKSVNDNKKFSGYLGSVTKPTFMKEPTINNNKRLSIDEDSAFNRYGNKNLKSTNQRIGLNDSLLNNTKIDLKLDADYLEKSKKVSNIIKLKDTESLSTDKNLNGGSSNTINSADAKKKNEKSLGPSSGFQFKINNEAINSIIERRNENEELVEKATLSQHEPFKLGGSTSQKKEEVPAKSLFSFGDNKKESKVLNEDAPKFGFGEEKAEAPKLSFGFGGSETKTDSYVKPSISFGSVSKDKPEETAKPSSSLFSFGKKDESTTTTTAASLFGEKKDEVSKPLFSIPSTTEKKEAPKLSFNIGNKSDATSDSTPKPLFSFGTEKKDETKTVPKFSFGETKSTSSSSTPIPSFSLTDAKPEENKKETTPFSFGKPSENGDKAESEPPTTVPKFSFSTPVLGKSTDEKSSTFQFGDSTKTTAPSDSLFGGNTAAASNKRNIFDSESSKPSIKFGENNASDALEPSKKRPAFSFGGKIDQPTSSASSDAATVSTPPSKPIFSFGNTSALNGSSATTTTSAPTSTIPNANPSFKFAAGITPNSKPVLNFGSATSQKTLSAPTANANPIVQFGSNNSSNNSISRSTTPVGNNANPGVGGFSFGSSTTNINPASVFGGAATAAGSGSAGNMFGQTTAPTFQFGGGAAATTRGSTPDPAAVFGGNGSREPTPFSFGGSANNGASSNNLNGLSMPNAQFGTPSNGGGTNPFGGSMMMNNGNGNVGGAVIGAATGIQSTPTPPILTGRKIAQMRQRRR